MQNIMKIYFYQVYGDTPIFGLPNSTLTGYFLICSLPLYTFDNNFKDSVGFISLYN